MTGIPNTTTNNYTVGKGLIYFNQFVPGTQAGPGEAYLGDCKGMSIIEKVTQLDHYQSTGGVKILDQSATIQSDATGQLMTENASAANVARFFLGSTSTVTQTAGTVTTQSLGTVSPGFYYQIGATLANPMGVQNLDPATPAVVANGATTYALGTDYQIDYPTGRILIVIGGAIPANTPLTVTYHTLATSKAQTISGTTPLEGSIRFIPNNITGTNRITFLPWVKLIPNATYELIGDKFIELTYDLKVLSLNGAPFVMFQDL